MKPLILLIIGCSFLGMIGCRNATDKVDLRETYGFKDTRPFGASIAHNLLQSTYPDNPVQIKKESFHETATWTSDTNSVYMNISKNYFLNETDVNSMLDFVYKGNTVMVATNTFGPLFLEKLFMAQSDSVGLMDRMIFLKDTKVKYVPALNEYSDSIHQYYYRPFFNYFSLINDRYARVVGYNDKDYPNFVVFFWGKGRLFLHCDPRAFSNYFLLQKNNYRYFLELLKIFPEKPQHVFWDDHYNKVNYGENGGDGSKGSSASIFNYPPLKWAFWILVLCMLLYILFNGKRKQRIIPIIPPVKNTSIQFAQAMSELYLKEKNNKLMAEKMVNAFQESVRIKYFINAQSNTLIFEETLSKKAGVSLEETQKMTRYFKEILEKDSITDNELQHLNQIIQQFN